MIEEFWAVIEDFPDYAISTHGRVFNLKFDSELRPRNNSYGYLRVTLRREGVSHEYYIHHLVAKTFVTGYHDKIQIKHHDGDNGNNKVDNLRFLKGKGLGQLRRKHDSPNYRRIRILETGMIFRTVEDCARYIQGDPSSIYRVLRGDRNSHKGHTFEYIYEGEDK